MKNQQQTSANSNAHTSDNQQSHSRSILVRSIASEQAKRQKVKGSKGTKVHALNRKKKAKGLSNNNLRKTMLVIRAVNHMLRQEIIDLLKKKGEMTVTEIYLKLKIEQCVASQHLAILRKAKIVVPKKNGKHVYYSLNKKRLSDIALLTETVAN